MENQKVIYAGTDRTCGVEFRVVAHCRIDSEAKTSEIGLVVEQAGFDALNNRNWHAVNDEKTTNRCIQLALVARLLDLPFPGQDKKK